MTQLARRTFSVLVTMLGLCSDTVEARGLYCPFTLRRIVQYLVLPELKNKLREQYASFDLDDPILFQAGARLEATLAQKGSTPDSYPLDADNFVVVIDTCKFKVLDSYFQSTGPDGGR